MAQTTKDAGGFQPPRRVVGGWLHKGAWTILDQALFSGANFVINVLLARWLSPEGFGAYTVAYTVFLLLGTVHGGLLVEPMLVFGSGRFRRRFAAYLGVLLRGHVRFALVAGVALAAVAVGFGLGGQADLSRALLILAGSQVLILLLWMLRSACYIPMRPWLAASASAVYAVVLLGGAALANVRGHLTVTTAIELMGLGSLLGSAWLVVWLRVPLRRRAAGPFRGVVWREHRAYGSWASATGGLEWLHGFLPFLILPIWAGLGATGALRALYNFVLPALHVYSALSNLLVPLLVRAREAGTLRRVSGVVGALFFGGSLVYFLALWLFGGPLMHALYDGKYDAYAGLLWLVGLLPFTLGLMNVTQAILRALERPREVFFARVGAVGTAVTAGALFVRLFGVVGALVSELLTSAAEAVLMLRGVYRALGARGAGEAAGAVADSGAAADGRKKVLMVAYACGPGRGSEPGQGWQFARGMAEHHEVWVLAYQGFQQALERELAERPVPTLHPVYVRLPFERARHWREGRDRRGLCEQAHYYLWQLWAGLRVRRLHREVGFDLAHHVSFMRYWAPSAAAVLPVPLVWGPVGGGESAPRAFYRAFGVRGLLFERLRDAARALAHRDPFVRRCVRRATLALATTPETAACMARLGVRHVEVSDSVALETDVLGELGRVPPPSGPVRFIAMGRLLHWKGFAFALEAFARAVASGEPALHEARFDVVGDGPERGRLEAQVRRLGLAGRVRFHGQVARPAALALLGRAHVLVHPSFHDSGGYVLLEGMAAGRPVLSLALGGPGQLLTPETGVTVPAETPAQVVAALAEAMCVLAADPARRAAMGAAGRHRVATSLRWADVVRRTDAHYARLTSTHGDGLAGPSPVLGAPVEDTEAASA